jgi:5-methylcytosine-specific restriction endonuclease McrA
MRSAELDSESTQALTISDSSLFFNSAVLGLPGCRVAWLPKLPAEHRATRQLGNPATIERGPCIMCPLRSKYGGDGNNLGVVRRYEWQLMLDGHVLVLNRVFQAVQITSARRALTLLYKGQVKAVDSEYRTYDFENWADIPIQADDDHFVRTPSRNILIPHVVQLLVFDRLPRQEVKFSRGNIYLRDSNRCQYCGKKFSSSELSLDHVVPISRGGKSTWENVVCACLPCNVKKGNKLLTETGLQLKRPPVRPRWHPLHRLQGRNFPDIWKNFLDEAYWNVELHA